MKKEVIEEFIKTFGVCYSHPHCLLKGLRCVKCNWGSTLKITARDFRTFVPENNEEVKQ